MKQGKAGFLKTEKFLRENNMIDMILLGLGSHS